MSESLADKIVTTEDGSKYRLKLHWQEKVDGVWKEAFKLEPVSRQPKLEAFDVVQFKRGDDFITLLPDRGCKPTEYLRYYSNITGTEIKISVDLTAHKIIRNDNLIWQKEVD